MDCCCAGRRPTTRRQSPIQQDALRIARSVHRRVDRGIKTRDLCEPGHPTCGVRDFTVVEDTAARRIVSSMCLIWQTWSCEEIEFGVGTAGAPSGTLPEYRRRGVIRAQFDVLHEWSASRGEKAQLITGLIHFYRQFGYEMAIELTSPDDQGRDTSSRGFGKGPRKPVGCGWLRRATCRSWPAFTRRGCDVTRSIVSGRRFSGADELSGRRAVSMPRLDFASSRLRTEIRPAGSRSSPRSSTGARSSPLTS